MEYMASLILTDMAIFVALFLALKLGRHLNDWLETQHPKRKRQELPESPKGLKSFNLSRFQILWQLGVGQITAFLFAIQGLNYYSELIGLRSWRAIWHTITDILPSWIPFIIPFGLVFGILSVGMHGVLGKSKTGRLIGDYVLIIAIIGGNFIMVFGLYSLSVIGLIYILNLLLRVIDIFSD
jgi:hypothetical protein